MATVRLVQPTATAWQRFLGTGPIALLPVRGGLANIVWTTTPAQVPMEAHLICTFALRFPASLGQLIHKHPATLSANSRPAAPRIFPTCHDDSGALFEQASELERCGPFEFAAAVNVALSKGQPTESPLAPLLDTVRSTVGPALGPVLGPVLGSALSGSNGPAFVQPPIAETAVGPPAKSFPLHLVHAGR